MRSGRQKAVTSLMVLVLNHPAAPGASEAVDTSAVAESGDNTISATAEKSSRRPLPLTVVTETQGLEHYSSLNLSPDGQWVAIAFTTTEMQTSEASEQDAYSSTGVPNIPHPQAILWHVKSGEIVHLCDTEHSCWAPAWSTDGKRVAYYSDEGGKAGVWVWEESSRTRNRFPGVVARPSLFFPRSPRWSSDSQKIISLVLPENMTMAQANALWEALPRPKEVFVRDDASVSVEQCCPDESHTSDGPRLIDPGLPPLDADLAMLDLRDYDVTRIVRAKRIHAYALSPDDSYLSYLESKKYDPNSIQDYDDLVVVDLRTGESQLLAKRIPMQRRVTIRWSPDSQHIAYTEGGSLANPVGEIVVRSLNGAVKRLGGEPSSNVAGLPFRAVFWDATGKYVYALGTAEADGQLWRIQVATNRAFLAGEVPGHRITRLLSGQAGNSLWFGPDDCSAFAMARERQGTHEAIYRIDLTTGKSRVVMEEERRDLDEGAFAASGNGKIAYIAGSPRDPGNVWLLDASTLKSSKVTYFNSALGSYELGTTRLIDYYSIDGRGLSGTLLLPPGYQDERRLPLVVWVYAGVSGSASANAFGLAPGGPVFNMQVLATRGYAVLWPDMPMRKGKGLMMQDILYTAMPAVNTVIEQGYADPERLAVMGHSAGSMTTLALITQTPRFKAAILAGQTQHPELFLRYVKAGPAGTAFMATGTPWTNRAGFIENSSFFFFDRIETPILIGQGALELDGSSPMDFIMDSLKRLRKPAEYRIYHNEGHVISRKANVIDFWEARLRFLADHLDIATDDQGAVIFEGNRAKSRKTVENSAWLH